MQKVLNFINNFSEKQNMKTLFFFMMMTVVSWTSFAATELLEASGMGRTHIDPLNMTTFINYKTNYQYDRPKVTYATCKLDASGNPIKNYFIIKRKDANGVVKNLYTIKAGLSCEEIQKNDANVVNCEGHSALEMSISDPDQCANGGCPQLSTPRVASTPLPINLNNAALQAEIKKCSPDRQFLLIKDTVTNKSLVASLTDKAQCALDKRRIATDGALWDDGESDLTQIYTSNRNGFYIGTHTHYFFDDAKKEWCVHFRPDLGSTAPVCGLNNTTKSIAFAFPSVDKKVQKGVVKLSTDKDGNPVAVVGHPKSAEYSRNPELDESKKLLKISLLNNDKEGRKTVFEAKNSLDGETIKKINVSPTYSLGASMNDSSACDSNACISAPKEVWGTQQDSALNCTKKTEAFKAPSDGKEVCYSCNGISSGACDPKKVLANQSNLEDLTKKTLMCQNKTPIDAVEDDNVEAEIQQ